MERGNAFSETMSEAAEGGATIAWRLLATLEGGSLLLAATAILAYTARGRSRAVRRTAPPCRSVAITNTSNELGKELKRRFEAHGCTVSTITSGATSGAESGAGDTYDALVVVGSKPLGDGLDALSGLVMDDVYYNIKLLERLSLCVNPGGSISWACMEGRSLGAFNDTAAAFDTVLHASLIHIAKVMECTPVWVGRGRGAQRTAERVVAALLTHHAPSYRRYSVRNAVNAVGGYFYRWLKTIT